VTARRFIRTIEDFTCEHCGNVVKGSGYTNHCPQCLWSKHVDVHPGDRAATCGGLMQPTDVIFEKGEQVLIHSCEKCDYQKRNKVADNDNQEALIAISANLDKIGV